MSNFLKRLELNGFKSFAGKTVLEFPAGIVAIVGPNGSGKCLKGDSLVFLSDGKRVAIRDLVESAFEKGGVEKMEDGWRSLSNPDDIHVFSLNLESQKLEKMPIAAFVKRKAPEYLLHITTRSGKEITATPYHPLFVSEGGKIKALRADELKVGVKIATPREYRLMHYENDLDMHSVFNAFSVDDLVYVPYSTTLKEYLHYLAPHYGGMRELCAATSVSSKLIQSVSSSQAMNISYMNAISRANYERGIVGGFKIMELKSKGKGIIKVPRELDRNLARFLGYIISEGRVNYSAAQVWFVNSDQALVEDFQKATREVFGVEAKEFSYKGPAQKSGIVTKDVIIFSKVLTKFLDHVFGLKAGGNSFEKKVPEQMFQASPDVAWEFISALFEGDGYFHSSERGKRHQLYVEYATASRELAFGLQTLLLREGVHSSVRAKQKYAANTIAKTKRTYYSVFISSAPNLKILFDNLNLIGEKNKKMQEMKALHLAANPNLDVVSGISPLVKVLVKTTGISVKRIRKISPKLAAYYEDRCDVSRNGIREVIDVVRMYGAINEKAEEVISQLECIADSDVFYDEIVGIQKESGEEWVYDLCVEKNHNFIANDIVAHNSNVVDSIRWLLGERDAKNLRGGKVEDLIFAGTQKRARVGVASASLYFENKHKFFPVDFEEVVVTRQVTRGGDSKYFLNKSEILLRDLIDFFAKARLGSRGLIIIGQGESDLFIRSTPMERREMIEEILGLREYQLKKSDAERRLKNSRINLDKTKALIEEILPHLRSLKRQTNRWDKRGEIEQELRDLENNFFGSQLHELAEKSAAAEATIVENKKQLEALQKELHEAETRQAKVESSQPEEKKELTKIKETVRALLEKRSAIQKDLGRLEAQIEIAQQSKPTKTGAVPSVDNQDVEKFIDVLKKMKTELELALQEDPRELHAVVESIIEEIEFTLEDRGGRSGRDGRKTAVVEESDSDSDSASSGRSGAVPEALIRELKALSENLKSLEKELTAFREQEKTLEESQEGFYNFFKNAVAEVQAAKNKIGEWENRNRERVLEKERLDLRRDEVLRQIEQAGRQPEDFKGAGGPPLHGFDLQEAERRLFRLRGELASIGEVDHALMKEAEDTETRYAFLTKESEDLEKAVADLNQLMHELSEKIKVEFDKSLHKINDEFNKFFGLMFDGGTAKLKVNKPKEIGASSEEEDSETVSSAGDGEGETEAEKLEKLGGVEIELKLARKKVTSLDALSGGERSLVGIAALFAMVSVSPPPFLVLDEIDAPLDERNARRFSEMLKNFSKNTQFIVVTHNRATMEAAEILYGITLDEDGSSKVVSLKLETE